VQVEGSHIHPNMQVILLYACVYTCIFICVHGHIAFQPHYEGAVVFTPTYLVPLVTELTDECFYLVLGERN
jgi:hypothetical protein